MAEWRYVLWRVGAGRTLLRHHSFVDGLHIVQFTEKLQKFFDDRGLILHCRMVD